MADRATSDLERGPSGRTDRHRSDPRQRLGIVRGKEGTTAVPAAEGCHGNPIGRVMTGGVGRDVTRQARDERCSAAGRAVALGQSRGIGRPRGNRSPSLAVGHDRVVSIGRLVVSNEPIAATRLGSGASQKQNSNRRQGAHDRAHEAARSESQSEGAVEAKHGTKNPGSSWAHESVATPPNTIFPALSPTVDRSVGCVNESAAGRWNHFAAGCSGVSFPSLSASQTVFACGSAMRSFPPRIARPTGPLSGSPVIHLVAVPSAATFQTARA